MKSLLAVPLIVLGMASAAWAQEPSAPPDASVISDVSPAPAYSPQTSETLTQAKDQPLISLATPHMSLAALSFASASAGGGATPRSASSTPTLSSAASAADPAPASPKPYGYNERDYNLEIALGVAVVRFRSPAYYATAVGPHVAAAFYFKDWLAAEGAITATFAPTIYAGENIRYLSYVGGPKISLGRTRYQPWIHVLAGGVHLVPQTALGGKNGFELTGGGGIDYALNPRVALRLEVDYLGSHLFGQWLNSGQGIAAVVFTF